MEYIGCEDTGEVNAAQQMQRLGYQDAKVTNRGADKDIDVRATCAAAQLKWRTAKTGRPDLQRLFGACSTEPHLQLRWGMRPVDAN
ncbi:restriction endonuclease [Nocardia brasiliensis]|uniref:restriction endonuclease n=1 Tax=Nocardia brasiliensis TaxID=37326 RepID=UPI00366F7CDC